MLSHTLEAADDLATNHRVEARVLSMHTIKPIDREAIVHAAQTTGGIVTVEDHNISTGLGAVVADVLATEQLSGIKFAKFGITDSMCHLVGSQKYFCEKMGNLESIVLQLFCTASRNAA
ncbi:MAG: transketolase C-terminal domain-containing protein [Pirellulales bacterium]